MMGCKLRMALAVVLGFAIANVVMFAIASANSLLYPEIVQAVAANDRAALAAAIAQTPGELGAFLVTLAAWALGSLAGRFAATQLAPARASAPALVVGALFMLGGVLNNLAFPPPAWFWVATLLVFVPPALAGARLAQRAALTPPRA